MKKILSILTVAALCFAVASCQKPNNPNSKPGPGPSDEPEPTDEFVAAITVDGDFADWGKATILANVTNTNPAGGGAQADGQRVGDLRVVKVAADGLFIYLYMEVDRNNDDGGGFSWDNKPLDPMFAGPLDIYINADNNGATGGIYWTWDPMGWEYLLESSTAFCAEPGDLADATLFKFTGEDGTDMWATDPPAREDVTLNGMAAGKGVVENGVVKYEMSLLRAALPGIGEKISLGVLVQSENWKLIGSLPSITMDPEAANITAGTTFEVTLPAAAEE